MSKGSGRRPLHITEDKFNDNWERIFGKGDNKESACKPAQHKDQPAARDLPPSVVDKDEQG